ncbi:MAG: pyridoxamine 5'-phosphate oxidase [Gammaproteobacteria bacterium]
MAKQKTPQAQISGAAEFARLRARPPLEIFGEWFADAQNGGIAQPEAMTLATAGADGMPQARIVLLKDFGEKFIFFTNRESRKGESLRANPRAALLFYWPPLSRQVKIEGNTAELERPAVAEYFQTRPRRSRISAWASNQSRPVESPETLARQMREKEEEFAGREPPLPPDWSGFSLVPLRMEFWLEGENRLHWRLAFWRDSADAAWQTAFLQP